MNNDRNSPKNKTTYQTAKAHSPLSAGAEYLEALYEDFQDDANAVADDWQGLFKDGVSDARGVARRSEVRAAFAANAHLGLTRALSSSSASAAEGAGQDARQYQIAQLINAYRVRGHEIANLDPLGTAGRSELRELQLSSYGLSEADLSATFNAGSLFDNQAVSLADILAKLQATYCASVGVEYMHIANLEEKQWLMHELENNAARRHFPTARKQWLLERLAAAEGLEKHLHSKYTGKKRFSLEGGESLMLSLGALVEEAGRDGVDEMIIGMAHRGRLNVLVNTMGKDPGELFEEFEGKHDGNLIAGDVKYHQGFSSTAKVGDRLLHLVLSFNPSHLEIVSPVVEGSARARQDRRKDTKGAQVLPVLIHGDAAFAGQGVVMETFNMSASRGFTTHGSVHVVVNNQIGFTTSFQGDARSTLYCTDVAKMLTIPIFHVNGDDPEAVFYVTKLAFEYRQKFQKDVIVDIVCYRRHGHNEADEPAVTQPNMYRSIRALPTTFNLYGEKLVSEGLMDAATYKATQREYREKLDSHDCVAPYILPENESLKNPFAVNWLPYIEAEDREYIDTALPEAELSALALRLLEVPAEFPIHKRVANLIAQRTSMAKGEVLVDWGFAETLAYATILQSGYQVRISGQDAQRGTFSHRHATYHNTEHRKGYTPLQHLGTEATFTIIDSVLSEEAVLAFEYGYACSSPESLVIWEAQFGDFANGAQVVIDQFLSSGEAKWGRFCGLVMLLPHGYEGQGPEHSSARPERFLQLCANDNMDVVNASTPAQIYHLLRKQALRKKRKPLIVFSPKSLLRHPQAVSSLAELSTGQFESVLDDDTVQDAAKIRDVVFCSGKVYYDLRHMQTELDLNHIALVRLERYYPFPYKRIAEIMQTYPNAERARWCQEEPKNQGAWRAVYHRFNRAITKVRPNLGPIQYAGRPSSASPAVGYMDVHDQEQATLLRVGLGLETMPVADTRWHRELADVGPIA